MAKTATKTVTVKLTEDQIRGLLDAASYWDTCEGGNNFESGYRGAEGKEERRMAKAARSAMKKLERKVDELDA